MAPADAAEPAVAPVEDCDRPDRKPKRYAASAQHTGRTMLLSGQRALELDVRLEESDWVRLEPVPAPYEVIVEG